MPGKKTRKMWLMMGLAAVVSACAPASSAAPTPTPLPPPVSYEKEMYTVERGPIVSQFTVTGQVLPATQDRLFFRTDGYVSRVLVQTGDEVQEGQLLAELQVDDLLKALEQAYIDLEVAQANLADLENDRQYAIEKAAHQVSIRQAQVELAREALAQETNRSGTQTALALEMAQEQLARLQASQADYDAAVLAASINLTRTQNTMAEAQIEYQKALDRTWEPDEVRQRYAGALQQAEWDHQLARAQYEKTLAAQEIYQHDLNIQALAVAQAEAALAESQQDNTTTLALQLQLAEENLALAQIDLEEVSEEISLFQRQTVERAKLTVERLETQLTDRQILAPYDGVILPRTGSSVREGDNVRAFQLVFLIGDPAELLVGILASQDRADEIKQDTRVYMSFSSDASTELYEVEMLSGFHPLSSQTGEGETFARDRIYFDMLSPPQREPIPVGKTVYILAVLGRDDDALLLPPAAIRSFRGRDFVIVQEGERRRRVDVTLGLASETRDKQMARVQVIGNLQEGDQVVGP